MKIKNFFYRKKQSCKNDFGHVLVIGSSYKMPGAGVLCSNAAICSGAGLVSFAFPNSAYNAVVKNIKPEIMLLPLKEKNGKLTKASQNEILNFIKKRKIGSVAIGCGMGFDDGVTKLILSIIKNFNIYVIIDADGINNLQKKQKNGILKDFINAKAKIIITPHPKEFERISGISYIPEGSYRKRITKTFAKNNDIICVLKGHKTVVSDGTGVYVNNTGNPGMATAGSGDVLTGIIASFVCNKGTSLLLKVSTAVYIHGLAGDLAGSDKTQVAMTASDIINNIPAAIRSIK